MGRRSKLPPHENDILYPHNGRCSSGKYRATYIYIYIDLHISIKVNPLGLHVQVLPAKLLSLYIWPHFDSNHSVSSLQYQDNCKQANPLGSLAATRTLALIVESTALSRVWCPFSPFLMHIPHSYMNIILFGMQLLEAFALMAHSPALSRFPP